MKTVVCKKGRKEGRKRVKEVRRQRNINARKRKRQEILDKDEECRERKEIGIIKVVDRKERETC